MSWIRKLRSLSLADLALLAEAQALLLAITPAVRILGLRRTRQGLNGLLANPVPELGRRADLDDPRRAAWAVDVAERRGLFRTNCLRKSLALWWMLRRRGCDARLVLGARAGGGSAEAHAWVECEGVVINDSDDVASRFPPFSGAAGL